MVSGIGAAWLASRYEPPEMLAVEEGYFYPARIDAGGDLNTPAQDIDHPEVIDDAVESSSRLCCAAEAGSPWWSTAC